jgi:hypothetical protein
VGVGGGGVCDGNTDEPVYKGHFTLLYLIVTTENVQTYFLQLLA